MVGSRGRTDAHVYKCNISAGIWSIDDIDTSFGLECCGRLMDRRFQSLVSNVGGWRQFPLDKDCRHAGTTRALAVK